MSSESNLAEFAVGERVPSKARQGAVDEAWPIEARILLALFVITLGIALLTMSRDTVSPSREPVGAAPNLVLDANSAPPQVLEALPTLGPALVRRWVAARSERPILSLDDARRRVRGLGPASIAQIAPYLKFKAQPVAPKGKFETRVAVNSAHEWGSIQTAAVSGQRANPLIGRK